MFNRTLTFYCRRHLTLLHVNQLKRLAALFRARITLINISVGQQAESEKFFALLFAAGRCGDLCQLLIEGVDAELAHMVLMTWVIEHGECLTNTSENRDKARRKLRRQLPWLHFSPDSVVDCAEPLTKLRCLQKISAHLAPGIVDDPVVFMRDLLSREAISATLLRAGIAVPHVLSPCVRRPCLFVLRCATPVDWRSPLGEATTIILMAAPAGGDKRRLRPFASLIQALLNDAVYTALTRAGDARTLYAILVESVVNQAGLAGDIATA